MTLLLKFDNSSMYSILDIYYRSTACCRRGAQHRLLLLLVKSPIVAGPRVCQIDVLLLLLQWWDSGYATYVTCSATHVYQNTCSATHVKATHDLDLDSIM